VKRVCVIPGDGIGPEVVAAARRVLDAVAPPVDYTEADAGLACRKRTGHYLPQATLDAALGADAVLFGAITSPLAHEDPDYKSVILRLRQALDLYANLRPAKDWGQPCLVPGLDLLLVRENSEGMYNCPEEEDAEGVTTFRRITKRGSSRVTSFALDLAVREKRREVTVVHKANVLRLSDGLFRRVFYEEAAKRASIKTSEMLVDNCALQLVRDPKRFDVIVTMNLYGDVLSDECAGLVGGLGFAPSGSYGPKHALFEPVHGSAPDIAGKGLANPTATILSAAMMLRHLGLARDAARVEDAVRAALAEGRTRDAGGTLSTDAFADLVAARVA